MSFQLKSPASEFGSSVISSRTGPCRFGIAAIFSASCRAASSRALPSADALSGTRARSKRKNVSNEEKFSGVREAVLEDTAIIADDNMSLWALIVALPFAPQIRCCKDLRYLSSSILNFGDKQFPSKAPAGWH